MMPADHRTDEQMRAHRRRVAFHQSIERKASELASRKLLAALDRSLAARSGARAALAQESNAQRSDAQRPDAPVTALPAISAPAQTGPPAGPCEKFWFCIEGLLPDTLSIQHIKDAVCREFDLAPRQLLSPRRVKPIVLARQTAMLLCRELLPQKSFPAIARQFGGMDHTTVIRACQSMPGKIATDPQLAASIARIRAELSQSPPLTHGART